MKKHFFIALIYIFSLMNSKSIIAQAYYPDPTLYLLTAATCSLTAYTLGKGAALYKEYTLPKASDSVHNWATCNGAPNIPLKIGNRWEMHADSFIEIPSEHETKINNHLKNTSLLSKEEFSVLKYALLHEKKHYDSQDSKKGYLVAGVLSAIPFSYIINTSFSNQELLNAAFLTSLSGLGLIAYSRYREKEADAYAYKNISEDMCHHMQEHWENKAKTIEDDLKKNDFYKNATPSKQRAIFEIKSLKRDWRHPSYKSRAEHAQKCLDSRKSRTITE